MSSGPHWSSAGSGGRTAKWTLKEIITRLGVKKVGAIAQQVKMINSLVKPEESKFDMKRFWEHSVGCAIIADKLYTERHVQLKAEIKFNDYWIGSLLQDVGKLVIGFSSGTGLSGSKRIARRRAAVSARLSTIWVMWPVTSGSAS